MLTDKKLLSMAVLFVALITRCIPDDYRILAYNPFVLAAVLSAVACASYFVINKGVKANPLLVASCFFIYACHAADLPKSPLVVIRKIFHFVIPGDTYFERIFCYLAVPGFTAAALVLAYWLMMRWFPKIGKLVCGGR